MVKSFLAVVKIS